MGRMQGGIRVLTQDEMDRIHRTTVRILAEVGMRIEHPEGLEYLKGFGCHVDFDRSHVLFPEDVIEAVLKGFREDAGREDRQGLRMAYRFSEFSFYHHPVELTSAFKVSAGGFPPYILDLEGNRRPANIEDVRQSIRLADALPEIDFLGLPCSAVEVEFRDRPLVMTAELLKGTNRLGGIEVWDRRDIAYVEKMATVVAGSREELRRRPILVGYGEAKSPLCFDFNMADLFVEYVKRGFPQSIDTMPNGGATAPGTSAGTLALGLAETLGGMILGYAIDRGARLRMDINPGLCDMRSGIFPYAGADRLSMLVGAAQMINQYYGCPGGIHGGKTDACLPGVQAGYEKALTILVPILAGATGIGTIGQLEAGMTYSPVQLVIDNEIVAYVRRILRGFEVNEDTLAFDVIKEVGIGGQYLNHEHTATHFRDEFFLTGLTERMPWAGWESEELKGVAEKAVERARRLMRAEPASHLSAEQEEEINEILKEALADPKRNEQQK